MAYFQKKAFFAVLKLKICSDASCNLALNFFSEDASILDAVSVSYQLLKPKLREKREGLSLKKNKIKYKIKVVNTKKSAHTINSLILAIRVYRVFTEPWDI